MKTVFKTVYEAYDGSLFHDADKCAEYERNTNPLLDHIIQKIDTTWNDDAGFGIIEETDVEHYIKSYWNDIKEIMESKLNVRC